MIVKTCGGRKSLHLFSEVFDIKREISVIQVGGAKSKRKEIRAGSMLCSRNTMSKGQKNIIEQVHKYLYNWILQHLEIVLSTVANDFIKVYIDGYLEPQLVSKLLLQVYVRELYNSMVSPPEEG